MPCPHTSVRAIQCLTLSQEMDNSPRRNRVSPAVYKYLLRAARVQSLCASEQPTGSEITTHAHLGQLAFRQSGQLSSRFLFHPFAHLAKMYSASDVSDR